MKKLKMMLAALLLMILSGLVTFGLTACGTDPEPTPQPEHTHTYTVWQYDETGHWKKCSEDDAIGEVSNHNFVDGTCECGYRQPTPPVKYGSAEAIVHLMRGEEPVSDYSDVTVSLNIEGPVVTLDSATGKLTITNLVAGKDYRLTVSKPDYISYEITICADENETVKIGGDDGIVVRYNKVSMTYTVANGAGYEVKLLDQDKNVIETKTVGADNTVTFDDLSTDNKYYLAITVFNIRLPEQEVDVNADGVANVNFGAGFSKDRLPPKTIEYSSEDGFAPYVFQNVNLEGDFFFAAKFQVTELTTGLDKEVRFGFRMKYGDQEYDHTFLIENGKWRMQQMNSWWGEDLTAAQTEPLMGDGLIVVISRVAATGEVILYYGTSVDNMVREPRAAWTANTEKQKNPITEFGIRLWGESGKGEYQAVVTPYGYGTTLAEALGLEKSVTVTNEPVENGSIVVTGSKVYDDFVLDIRPETDCTLKSLTINGQDAMSWIVDGKIVLKAYNLDTLTIVPVFERTIYGQIDANVTVNKHGTSSYALADGTQVTLSNTLGSYSATVTDGKISLRVPVGTYKVSVDGYNDGTVTVTESGVSDDIAVEYILFSSLKGWDTDRFDASNANAENATITQNGKTLNILTLDSYGNVVATLHVKAGNSTHVNHTQGIIIQYADGKNMIIDIVAPDLASSRITWEKNGIWSLAAVSCENKYGTDWELGAGEQHYNRPFPQAAWDAFNGDGFDLTVVREGNMLYIYVDDNYAGKFEVPEEYATQTVKVGFFSYDSAENATWAFSIGTDISAYAQDVTVTTGTPANGSVSLNKDSYVLGDMVEVTIAANSGYVLKKLTVDGEDVTSRISAGVYSFEAMKRSYAVEATFEEKTEAEYDVAIVGHKYGVTGNSVADGTVVTLDGGALGTFTATVTEGRIAGTLPIGTFDVKLAGYIAKQVQVTATGIADDITLEYDLMYNIATTWNWGDQIDFTRQNDGVVIKAPEAGVLWAATKAQYNNVAITTTFVENGGGRQGAFIKFGNAYVLVQLEPGSGDNAGKYKITWNAQNPCSGCGTTVLTGWSELVGYGFGNWTDELTQKLQAGTLQVTLVRKDAVVLAFIDGKLVGQAYLKDAQIGQTCEVGVYIQSAPTDRAIERKFVIEEDISGYTYTEQFGLQNTADQSQVSEGVLKSTGNMEVATLETYQDMTAEFNWKYPGSGTRYGFAIVYGDGNVIRFDVRYNDNGTYDIQRCGWGNVSGYGWQDGVATYDAEQYASEGLSFKVVRQGSSLKIWLNGTLIVNYENIGDGYADDAIRLRFNTEGASEIHYSITPSVTQE